MFESDMLPMFQEEKPSILSASKMLLLQKILTDLFFNYFFSFVEVQILYTLNVNNTIS
jgi:hypothetical protein